MLAREGEAVCVLEGVLHGHHNWKHGLQSSPFSQWKVTTSSFVSYKLLRCMRLIPAPAVHHNADFPVV